MQKLVDSRPGNNTLSFLETCTDAYCEIEGIALTKTIFTNVYLKLIGLIHANYFSRLSTFITGFNKLELESIAIDSRIQFLFVNFTENNYEYGVFQLQ